MRSKIGLLNWVFGGEKTDRQRFCGVGGGENFRFLIFDFGRGEAVAVLGIRVWRSFVDGGCMRSVSCIPAESAFVRTMDECGDSEHQAWTGDGVRRKQ